MTDIRTVRQALIDTVTANVETTLYGYRVIKGSGNLPALIVEPDEGDYEIDMRGSTVTWRFNCWVLCSAADLEAGQDELDEFITPKGPNSIPEILYNHSDLGIDATDTAVRKMRGYGGAFEWYNVDHVGCLLVVDVLVSA